MVRIIKKTFHKYICLSCSHDWKDKRDTMTKCPSCGSDKIKLVGYSGYIGPIDEEPGYAPGYV